MRPEDMLNRANIDFDYPRTTGDSSEPPPRRVGKPRQGRSTPKTYVSATPCRSLHWAAEDLNL